MSARAADGVAVQLFISPLAEGWINLDGCQSSVISGACLLLNVGRAWSAVSAVSAHHHNSRDKTLRKIAMDMRYGVTLPHLFCVFSSKSRL